MPQPDDSRDRVPIPDPTVLTTRQLEREIAHLKELMERDRDAEREARKVALDAMDRRLLELPDLRNEIVKVRGEFVRGDVYGPAHEDLRRQREADGKIAVAMASDIKTNATTIAKLENSIMWLSRLVIGALISGVILYAFQRLMGR